jgi:hypothetical protein
MHPQYNKKIFLKISKGKPKDRLKHRERVTRRWKQRLVWHIYKPKDTKDCQQPAEAGKRQQVSSSRIFRKNIALLMP